MDGIEKLTPEEHFSRGLLLLDAGHAEAFEHLTRAYLADPESPRRRSAYALGLALIRGQFVAGIELARRAVQQSCADPDLYLDLARIHLAIGAKAEAVRNLRRGLMVAPEHERLHRELAKLGVRRSPPFRFLPRNHLLNRGLGRIHCWLAAHGHGWLAAGGSGA
jgi:tetratricopeptide (TPR) repeat protein